MEEDTTLAESLASSGHDLIAPSLIQTEVANALWKKKRKGAIDLEGAQRVCDHLPGFFKELIAVEPLLQHAITLSFAYDHTIYDCIYLSLAHRRKCPLVTADRRLADKVQGHPLTPKVLHLSQWQP
ncbi:type II toxin-antitoxin system VapC family toxin [Aquabacter spiritensis]|uniref:type II toxin-antitoxin system VapC family toxin n=1 Tax=Aquabacter spiritensis TaxID=933073 RepID=UPI0010441362|nr:type II toxin-antitoxin system VapC family toxin [Aquabacter spiritensis]